MISCLTPLGQRLDVARRLLGLAEMVDGRERRDLLARDHLAVDEQPAVGHLDLVARQADQALDVVGLAVARQLEHDDVAALGLRGEDAAGHRRGGEVEKARQRKMRIAVGVFRHEQVVADEQRRHQRTRGNVERLKEQRAHDERDQQRLDDDLDGLPPALFLLHRRRARLGGLHALFAHLRHDALPLVLASRPAALPIQTPSGRAKRRGSWPANLAERWLAAALTEGERPSPSFRAPPARGAPRGLRERQSTADARWSRRRSRPRGRARAPSSRAAPRSARKVNSVGLVAKSEPLRPRRPRSKLSMPPEAEPKLANMPNGLRQSSEAGKVALPTPS